MQLLLQDALRHGDLLEPGVPRALHVLHDGEPLRRAVRAHGHLRQADQDRDQGGGLRDQGNQDRLQVTSQNRVVDFSNTMSYPTSYYRMRHQGHNSIHL